MGALAVAFFGLRSQIMPNTAERFGRDARNLCHTLKLAVEGSK